MTGSEPARPQEKTEDVTGSEPARPQEKTEDVTGSEPARPQEKTEDVTGSEPARPQEIAKLPGITNYLTLLWKPVIVTLFDFGVYLTIVP